MRRNKRWRRAWLAFKAAAWHHWDVMTMFEVFLLAWLIRLILGVIGVPVPDILTKALLMFSVAVLGDWMFGKWTKS